ncbi:MAG: acyltransferase family protein [Chitinophagaceae bacterium]
MMFSQFLHISDRQAATPVTIARTGSRLQWVDYARGLAIMLVVYRHVIVGMKRAGLPVSQLMYDLQEVVYNFRMPVFFVLSGIFLAGSLARRSHGEIAKNRVFTILYPYIVWGSITVILQIVFSGFTNSKRSWTDLFNLLMDPRAIDHLWYLLALFNTNVLYLLLNRLLKDGWLHALLAVGMYILSRMPLMHGNSFMADMCYFYLYLYVGVKISSVLLESEKRERILNVRNLLWLIPLVFIGQYFWFQIWQMDDYASEERKYLPLFFLINLLACYFMYILSYKVSLLPRTGWLAWLGKHSLYIYILHVFVASAIRTVILKTAPDLNVWVIAVICWTFALVVPVLLYNWLRPFGFDKLFSLKKNN